MAAFANSGLTSTCNTFGFPALTIDFLKKQGNDQYCPVMIIAKHFEDHRVIQFDRFIETLIL